MAKTATTTIWRLAPIDPQAPPFYLAQVPSFIIVAAPDAEHARRIASQSALTPHDAEAWLDEKLSSCEVLTAEEPGIIARDFTPPPPPPPFTPGAAAPPANVDVPVLGGDGTVGETLTCTMGNWTGEPTSYAYAWHRDDEALGSGPVNTYDVTTADADHAITCVVTATNALGDTAAPPSNAVKVDAVSRRR